jgi:hypothetical protein
MNILEKAFLVSLIPLVVVGVMFVKAVLEVMP